MSENQEKPLSLIYNPELDITIVSTPAQIYDCRTKLEFYKGNIIEQITLRPFYSVECEELITHFSFDVNPLYKPRYIGKLYVTDERKNGANELRISEFTLKDRVGIYDEIQIDRQSIVSSQLRELARIVAYTLGVDFPFVNAKLFALVIDEENFATFQIDGVEAGLKDELNNWGREMKLVGDAGFRCNPDGVVIRARNLVNALNFYEIMNIGRGELSGGRSPEFKTKWS